MLEYLHVPLSIIASVLGLGDTLKKPPTCSAPYTQKQLQVCQKVLSHPSMSNLEKYIRYLTMSDVFMEQNRDTEALRVLNKAITLFPRHPMAYEYRIIVFFRQQKLDDALRDTNMLIDINPVDAGNYVNKGLIYRRQNKLKQALEQYNKSIDLDPTLAMAYNNRGYVHRHMKKYKKAIADFEKAIKLEPNDTSILHSMGDVYFDKGDEAKAMEYWKRSCKTATKRITYGRELDLHRQGYLLSKPDEICDKDTLDAFKRCAQAKCISGS